MGKTAKMDLDEYSNYIKNLSREELEDIYRHIDKESFPERYKLVKKTLNKKTTQRNMPL